MLYTAVLDFKFSVNYLLSSGLMPAGIIQKGKIYILMNCATDSHIYNRTPYVTLTFFIFFKLAQISLGKDYLGLMSLILCIPKIMTIDNSCFKLISMELSKKESKEKPKNLWKYVDSNKYQVK